MTDEQTDISDSRVAFATEKLILGVIDNNILQVRGLIKVVERGGQPESPQHQQQK